MIFRCTSSTVQTRNHRSRATNLLRVGVSSIDSIPSLTAEMCPRVATAITPRTARAWSGLASYARGGRSGSGWTGGSPPPSGRGRGSGGWVKEEHCVLFENINGFILWLNHQRLFGKLLPSMNAGDWLIDKLRRYRELICVSSCKHSCCRLLDYA